MSAPLLLLVIFDGLGHNVVQQNRHILGNLTKLMHVGPATNNGISPIFPTITTPNLMSIATGLYSETHGIVANDMIAEQYEKDKYNNPNFTLFTKSDDDPAWWDNHVNMPVWTLNELASSHSVPRHSGAFFWPGAGSTYRNKAITHYYPYNERMSWYKQVDIVIEWLTHEQKPANCVFLYFDQPDIIFHDFGPHSSKFIAMLERVNDVFGYLLQRIEQANLEDKINIIVSSDHGMVDVPLENYNLIDDLHIPRDWYKVYQNSVTWNIDPLPGYYDRVYEVFFNGSKHMNFSIWKMEEFPEVNHFKHANHLPSLFLVTDEGFRTVFSRKDIPDSVVGWHGYNNTLQSMKSMFYAQGPAFNPTARLNSFELVDLYVIMCKMLDVMPGPHNGSYHRVAQLLNHRYASYGHMNVMLRGLAVVLILFLLFLLVRLYKGRINHSQRGIIGIQRSKFE